MLSCFLLAGHLGRRCCFARSFFAVLVDRHACCYRESGSAEHAESCTHAALTSTGQPDQNLPAGSFLENERNRQLEVIVDNRTDEFAAARSADQIESRERLMAIMGRLR